MKLIVERRNEEVIAVINDIFSSVDISRKLLAPEGSQLRFGEVAEFTVDLRRMILESGMHVCKNIEKAHPDESSAVNTVFVYRVAPAHWMFVCNGKGYIHCFHNRDAESISWGVSEMVMRKLFPKDTNEYYFNDYGVPCLKQP